MADIEGLTVEQAIQLCCQRHNELTSDELKFMQRLTGKGEAPKGRGGVRLGGIVRRLRQMDLIAYAERLRRESAHG